MLRTASLIFYRRYVCGNLTVDSVVKQHLSLCLSLSIQPHAADIGHEQRAE